jgi:aspartyl-tRNA(Asn)/glutamyl-tRNA(Gln) amidotransferase subunit C
MAIVSEEELIHLIKLCKIACSKQKQQALLRDFQNIVSYIDQLSKIDTTGIEPCVCVSKNQSSTLLREDLLEEGLERELFIQNAPSSIAGLIRVPTVLHSKEAK